MIMFMFLRFAPFIAIGLLVLAVGWFKWDADVAKAARDAAIVERDLAVQANEQNQITITRLEDWQKANNELMLELAGQLEAERKRDEDERLDIEKLGQGDEAVRNYLAIPIPDSLKRVLNRQ